MGTEGAAAGAPEPGVALRVATSAGRRVLLASVLGSGMLMVDASAVSVALPVIGDDLSVGLSSLQWIMNAFTLTLASFLLLGGALGDRFGRRRAFRVGIVWFGLASVLCVVARDSAPALIAARGLQGLGAALLAPGGLAILQATFARDDRGRAIGIWSGTGSVMAAIGPFIGGYLVSVASWHWIFLVNVPLAVVAFVMARAVPETRQDLAPRLDLAGSLLVAAGLGCVVWALVEGPAHGWKMPSIVGPAAAGLVGLVAFVLVERRRARPVVPLELFRSGPFRAAIVVTLCVYGAMGGALFLLPIQLQVVVGMSPVAAGAALLPMTVLMLVGSPWSGRLAARVGPRLPLTIGPLVASVGLALMARIDASSGYAFQVMPSITVFGAGLALTVAPLAGALLASVPDEQAGVASAVNTTVARIGGLLAVALLPLVGGLTNTNAIEPAVFTDGFRTAVLWAAGLMALAAPVGLATAGRQDLAREGAWELRCGIDALPLCAIPAHADLGRHHHLDQIGPPAPA